VAKTVIADAANKATDQTVDAIEKKIKTVYRRAYNEMRQTIIDFKEAHKVKSEAKLAKVASGEMTQEEYNKWEAGQQFQGKLWEEKKAHLLDVVNSANKKAVDIVNGETKNVFVTNANYQGYELEKELGASVSFSMYDSNTVARLIKDDPKLLPQKKVNDKKDKAWNEKKVNSAITQGILQGRTIPEIADSLSTAVSDQNEAAMVRTARTAMTSAENAGRLEGMKQAEESGIQMKKQWLAANDDRVRETHAALDGQIVDVDEPFRVDGMEIMYPGDPSADPSLVYNCRCTLKYIYPKFSKPGSKDYYLDKDGNHHPVTDTTFKEWVALKEQQQADEEHHAELADQYETAALDDVLGVMDMDSFDQDQLLDAIGDIAKEHGMEDYEVWDQYLSGTELSHEEKKEVDMILDKYSEHKQQLEEEKKKAEEEAAKKAEEEAKKAAEEAAKKAEEEAKKAAEEEAKKKAEEEAQKKAEEEAKQKAEEEAKKKAEEEAAAKAAEEAKKEKEEKVVTHDDIVSEYLEVDDGTGNYNQMTFIDTMDMLDSLGEDAEDFKKLLDEYSNTHPDVFGMQDAFEKYLDGTMDADTKKSIDELILKNVDPSVKLAEEEAAEELTHSDLVDKFSVTWSKMTDMIEGEVGYSGDFEDVLSEYADAHSMGTASAWKAYKNGLMDEGTEKKIDQMIADTFGLKIKGAESQASVPEVVEIFNPVKEKAKSMNEWEVTSQLYDKKEKDAVHEWQELKSAYYNEHGYMGKNFFDAYKDGELDEETTKKIDGFIEKTITKTSDDKVHLEAYEAVHDKGITEFKKELASVNNKLSTDFGKELKSIGDELGVKPKDVFEAYKNDNLSPEQTEKLDGYLKTYFEKKNAGETHTVKHKEKTPVPEAPKVSDAELHKTFSGIWKDDVTYADYEDKKDKIDAKKLYFEDQIEQAKNSGDSAKQSKFEGLLADLEEFEKHGKEYSALLAQESASQAAYGAQSGTTTIASGGGLKPLTAAEKKAAKSYRDKREADKAHRAYLDKIWPTLTDEQKYGIWEYTRNSNPMNKSLSGYHDSWSRRNFVGMDKTVWGHEDSWRTIDARDFRKFAVDGHVSYHKAITAATQAIEKSILPESCWLVRGSDTGGLAGLLESQLISFDRASQLLNSSSASSFEQLKSIIMNQTFTNHAFTSTGIATGTGFGGDVKYKILAPKGTKAIYAEPQSYYGNTSSGGLYKAGQSYSSVGGEAEIILQRGTTFRVSNFTKNGSSYEIELEVVEQPSYFKNGDEDTYNNGRTRHKK